MIEKVPDREPDFILDANSSEHMRFWFKEMIQTNENSEREVVNFHITINEDDLLCWGGDRVYVENKEYKPVQEAYLNYLIEVELLG